jgi:hypothetical protein
VKAFVWGMAGAGGESIYGDGSDRNTFLNLWFGENPQHFIFQFRLNFQVTSREIYSALSQQF